MTKRRKGSFWLRVGGLQCIMAGQAKQQTEEATGLIASVIWKWRDMEEGGTIKPLPSGSSPPVGSS